MGTETGCTTSIFPSDEITRAFMKAQGREDQWEEIIPDENAQYDEIIEINLDEVVPMVALPHSPGNVKKVSEIAGLKVNQVNIGSCTNSSLRDLYVVAKAIENKTIAENLHMTISAGSRQVVEHMIDSGEMKYLVKAGARLLENACGPCIGMGLAPCSHGVSVRTFNRNFEGRSGTKDAQVYLVSPETAVATAINGVLTDPRTLGKYPKFEMPEKFSTNDNMIIKPLPIEKAKEVMEIYAPLAHRLGISKIKWELEDYALRYLDPEGYYELVDKVAIKRKEREDFINDIVNTLRVKIKEIGIECSVDGRPKHFYSIYKKMKTQNKTIDQIFDLFALRVIVDSVKDCYSVLGLVHELYKPMPGRF
jgi:hypothetical protein